MNDFNLQKEFKTKINCISQTCGKDIQFKKINIFRFNRQVKTIARVNNNRCISDITK